MIDSQDLRSGYVIFQTLRGCELIEARIWGKGELSGIAAASCKTKDAWETNISNDSSIQSCETRSNYGDDGFRFDKKFSI